MPTHFDVHVIRVIHVIVPEDSPDPEEAAIELAIQEFGPDWDYWRTRPGGSNFFATDRNDVYPTATQNKPCGYCQED